MKPSIEARGKGYMQLVREAESLLEMVVTIDPATGMRSITCEALETILMNADDSEHLEDPLAQALYRFIVDRKATIVLPGNGSTRGSA